MKVKINTIDDYFAMQSEKNAEALAKLWEIIQKASPKAEVGISYGIPIFKYHGMLVGFGGYKNHCSFFTCSGSVVNEMKKELKGYETTAGSIHFSPDSALPAALVKKIVKLRMEQNLEKSLKKKSAKKSIKKKISKK